MTEAQKAAGNATKKQTVEQALRLMIRLRQQQEVRRLLGNIVEGDMTLREAADFIDDVNEERK